MIDTTDKFLQRAQRAAKGLRQMLLPKGYNQKALNASANIIDALVLRDINASSICNHIAVKRMEADAKVDALSVTRFEVIDETGRAYSRHGVKVELSYQDDGRTLKVFMEPRR